MKIRIINRSKHSLPDCSTTSASGMDIRANMDSEVILKPMKRRLVNTGLYLGIKEGYEARIRPGGGLTGNKGITVLNSPGTIDADYRGENYVIMINLSNEDFVIKEGERI